MPPRSAAAIRSARFRAAQLHQLQTVGTIAGVFTGVLEVLALLLWVPYQALLPLALLGLPLGWVLGWLEVVVVPVLIQRYSLRRAKAIEGLGHLLLLGLLYGGFRLIAEQLGRPHLWAEPAAETSGPLRQLLLVPVVYGLAVYVTSLMRQLLLRMSSRRLRELLGGRYQQPETEERIFLFVDLKDSTRLAEELGNDRYSRLVRDFFRHVSPAVTGTRGEVYQYVGDEMVVTWLMRDGLTFANCLHCFFEMQRRIQAQTDYYLKHYGEVPGFKAGAHGGQVTTVLVGTVHHELVYHGDVLNTTARIQALCNGLESRFLLSEALREQLGPQPEFAFTPKGSHKLRGKAGHTTLYDVQEYLPQL